MVKIKCSQCNRVIRVKQGEGEGLPVFKGTLEGGEGYGRDSQKALTLRCPYCGAVNVVPPDVLSAPVEAPESALSVPLTKEAMRENVIKALKAFYPKYRGYNGGHLAPVRDPDPDLFMRVLTELEQEGVIEYNDTQIALRLSDKFMKSALGVR